MFKVIKYILWMFAERISKQLIIIIIIIIIVIIIRILGIIIVITAENYGTLNPIVLF